jgi:hypothetical protein
VLVEQRDRQAVELRVRRLRHDLVDDVDAILVGAHPVGDDLAEELALLGLGRGEDLHAGHIDHAGSFVIRRLGCSSGHVDLAFLLRGIGPAR